MDNTTKNNPKDFATNLLQKGKEAGMIWNGVIWVPAAAVGTNSKVSKSPKITEVSRVSKGKDTTKGITEYTSKNFSKSFTKIFDSIASEISSIKKTLVTFVKGQEKIKKKTEEEKLKEKNEAYKAKYKKNVVKKEPEKISEEPKKSFFEFLKDLFKNILKFFAIGLGLIGLSKFFNIGDVKETIKNLIVKIITTISDLIEKGADLVHDLLKPGETSNKIIEFIEKVIRSVIQVVSDFVDFIRSFVQKVAADDALLGNIQSIIENIIITLFTVIKTTVESLKNVFQKIGPELTEGIIKGITFILEGIASGIQFLTSLVNDPAFRQSFADVFQAMYDLIASIFDIEVPVPVFGTVKLGTIVAIVTASMVAFDAVMKGIVGYLVVRAARSGMKSGIRAAGATKTGCSDILGGSGKPGKPGSKPAGRGGRFLDALGGTLGVVQAGGLIIGAGTAAYAFSESSQRGDDLRQKYANAPAKDPTSTVPSASASTSGSTSTPTSTSASTAVPLPMSTPSTSGSTTSPTPARPMNQSPSGMPKTLLEYVSMEFDRKKAREGFRNKAYASPEGGTDTIGIGHKLSKEEQDRGGVFIGGQLVKADRNTPLTDQQVKDLYIQDIMKHADGAKRQVNKLAGQDVWNGLNPMQQYALMDLSFAGGPGLITKDLADAIKLGDMSRAAQIIQQKARTYRKDGVMIESKHHAKHADLRADIFRGYDPLLTGGTGTPTALASYTPNEQRPSKPIPQSPGVNLASVGQSISNENPFKYLENLLPTEPDSMGSSGSSGGMMENVVSKSLGASPSMTSSNKNVAQFLDSASQELTKLMQDNELLGMFFKDQTAKAGSKSQDVIAATNTNTKVNPEINSGIGSVYDEEFVKKVFG